MLGATENALGSLADEADIEFGITFELGVPKPFLTFKANKKAREVIRILRDKVDA